eukprot:COSAG02_NODE_6672_length_3427_cov_2.869892_1_plen_94_part_00
MVVEVRWNSSSLTPWFSVVPANRIPTAEILTKTDPGSEPTVVSARLGDGVVRGCFRFGDCRCNRRIGGHTDSNIIYAIQMINQYIKCVINTSY